MRRNCSLEEISDGKLYTVNDLVTVSCNGCKGEASCCHGMGNSIILDPLDLYNLTTNLKVSFEQLLADKMELNLVDGIILPNLKMSGESESCNFLNQTGKCNIHAFRPGICRIFPLGRYYENHAYQYFLQKNECKNNSNTKTKVSKWIAAEDVLKNEKFLIEWHYLLNDAEGVIKNVTDETLVKKLNMFLLNNFYIKAYSIEVDFYQQFEERLRVARSILSL